VAQVIAIDTNVLVHAHRRDSQFHEAAKRALIGLAENRAAWAIPWPCLHEFVCVVTHPRIYRRATPLVQAIGQVEAWLASPSVVVLGEPMAYWAAFCTAATQARAAGPLVYDARIVTICQLHGVRELWTADRDFSRFPGIAVWNPLLSPDALRESAPPYGASRRVRGSSVRGRARRRPHAPHSS
jgi:uncharacterized protein